MFVNSQNFPKPAIQVIGWVGLGLFALGLSLPSQSKSSWDLVKRKDGITIHRKDVPGQSVPTVRAVATLDANIEHVLQVILDPKKYNEWNPDCEKATLLKQPGPRHVIFYFLTNVPWPASDRDVITELKATPGKNGPNTYRILIQKYEDALYPPQKGIERIPMLNGHYLLTAKGPKQTQLEYVITAETGGFLPSPLVSFFTVRSPVNLISGLRKQLKKTAPSAP